MDAVAEVIAAGDDVPFAVFGHSLGAIMAYEVSVQLEKSDRAPEFICVSSCRPPHVRDAPVEERWDDERLFTRVASMGEIPRELLSDPESREMCLANIRADWELYAGYTAPSLRCVDRPIVVMYGDADPDCSKEDAEAWGRYTRRSTKVIPFAGGHFYLKDCWREIAKECLWLFQAPGREV